MSQLTVVAKITAKPGKEDATKEALLALIPTTLAEEGCLNYDMHVSCDEPGTFLFYENWASRETWEAHINNDHLQAFIASAEELLAKDVEISTWLMHKA
ncbi:MAG: putative quinol monooxygenase [Verrucomicrobiota bacterium]